MCDEFVKKKTGIEMLRKFLNTFQELGDEYYYVN